MSSTWYLRNLYLTPPPQDSKETDVPCEHMWDLGVRILISKIAFIQCGCREILKQMFMIQRTLVSNVKSSPRGHNDHSIKLITLDHDVHN
jgi:hypothetical protein